MDTFLNKFFEYNWTTIFYYLSANKVEINDFYCHYEIQNTNYILFKDKDTSNICCINPLSNSQYTKRSFVSLYLTSLHKNFISSTKVFIHEDPSLTPCNTKIVKQAFFKLLPYSPEVVGPNTNPIVHNYILRGELTNLFFYNKPENKISLLLRDNAKIHDIIDFDLTSYNSRFNCGDGYFIFNQSDYNSTIHFIVWPIHFFANVHDSSLNDEDVYIFISPNIKQSSIYSLFNFLSKHFNHITYFAFHFNKLPFKSLDTLYFNLTFLIEFISIFYNINISYKRINNTVSLTFKSFNDSFSSIDCNNLQTTLNAELLKFIYESHQIPLQSSILKDISENNFSFNIISSILAFKSIYTASEYEFAEITFPFKYDTLFITFNTLSKYFKLTNFVLVPDDLEPFSNPY